MKHEAQVQVSGIWGTIQASAKGNLGAALDVGQEISRVLISHRGARPTSLLLQPRSDLALRPPGPLTCQLLFSRGAGHSTLPVSPSLSRTAFPLHFTCRSVWGHSAADPRVPRIGPDAAAALPSRGPRGGPALCPSAAGRRARLGPLKLPPQALGAAGTSGRKAPPFPAASPSPGPGLREEGTRRGN